MLQKREIPKDCKAPPAQLLLAGIIAACLKLTFHSPRPFTVLEHARQLTVPTEPDSFPSGHPPQIGHNNSPCMKA